MSAKSTQGEWRNEERAIYAGEVYIGQATWCDDVDAGIFEQAKAPVDEQEAIANARLMAAAPNLRDALVQLFSAVHVHGSVSPRSLVMENAVKAIAQAEGRTE